MEMTPPSQYAIDLSLLKTPDVSYTEEHNNETPISYNELRLSTSSSPDEMIFNSNSNSVGRTINPRREPNFRSDDSLRSFPKPLRKKQKRNQKIGMKQQYKEDSTVCIPDCRERRIRNDDMVKFKAGCGCCSDAPIGLLHQSCFESLGSFDGYYIYCTSSLT